MKTSELIGPALDWAVAKCEGRSWPDNAAKFLGEQYYRPSTDWSQGGPIIEREQIGLDPVYCDGKLDGWRAAGHDLEYDENGEYIDGSDHMQYGPTPLIAAMRCLVASKLGDEVEIPEELK